MTGELLPLRMYRTTLCTVRVPQLCGVYFIRCDPNARTYVGSSYHMRRRILEHRNELRSSVHLVTDLQSDYARYGESMFTAGVLKISDHRVNLTELEQFWMDRVGAMSNLYNVSIRAWRLPDDRIKRGPTKRVLVPGRLRDQHAKS